MSEHSPDVLRKPIIVLGSPRSGTTFLGSILSQHPDLCYLPEPRLVWKYGNDRKSDFLTAADARPEVRRYIRQVFAEAAQKSGKRRVLEKTPSNALRVAFVDQVFPDAKFVHILRDGTQSVLSIRRFWEQHARGLPAEKIGARLKELSLRRAPHYAKEAIRRLLPKGLARWAGHPVWGPRLPGIDGMLRDLDLLDVCCLQWRMCVEVACQYGRALPPSRYLECRLEEMSPELVGRVLQFTELEDAVEVWEAFESQFDPSQPARRSAAADPAEIEQIRKWIEPTMAWLDGTS